LRKKVGSTVLRAHLNFFIFKMADAVIFETAVYFVNGLSELQKLISWVFVF